jgi:hypothetical protein
MNKLEIEMKSLLYFTLIMFLLGCASKNTTPAFVGEELIWVSDTEKPSWVMESLTEENGKYLFKGQSYFHATERGAEEDAFSNAINKAIKHTKLLSKGGYVLSTSGENKDSEIQSRQVNSNSFESIESLGIVYGVKTLDTYTEQWSGKKGVKFRTYMLIGLSEDSYNKLLSK